MNFYNSINQEEEKIRLDILLPKKGLIESREKAKQLILNDCVYVDEKILNKPSAKVSPLSDIKVINPSRIYVGRGASKLEKAIKHFNISVDNTICVDVGASTGGFTEVLLRNGAGKVYAVDVGHDQLHPSLKNNEKVVNIENTNFRYIDRQVFKESIDIVVVDVSFISLSFILPKIVEISRIDSDIITLVKPQFEAGKSNVGKNGIVKDKKVHLFVLNNFNNYCGENNMYIENITFSPIKGGNGNIEYLAYLKHGNLSKVNSNIFKSIIDEAFELK